MHAKFGRELQAGSPTTGFDMEFQVESYLRYQGSKFAAEFDANTYLLMTKTLDHFDPAKEYGNDLTRALSQAQTKFLVISFTSDWRFSPARSREIVRALLENNIDVVYAGIEADEGHDAFLMKIPQYLEVLSVYMQRVAADTTS
jgi:homoserine O-acetyltransferase